MVLVGLDQDRVLGESSGLVLVFRSRWRLVLAFWWSLELGWLFE